MSPGRLETDRWPSTDSLRRRPGRIRTGLNCAGLRCRSAPAYLAAITQPHGGAANEGWADKPSTRAETPRDGAPKPAPGHTLDCAGLRCAQRQPTRRATTRPRGIAHVGWADKPSTRAENPRNGTPKPVPRHTLNCAGLRCAQRQPTRRATTRPRGIAHVGWADKPSTRAENPRNGTPKPVPRHTLNCAGLRCRSAPAYFPPGLGLAINRPLATSGVANGHCRLEPQARSDQVLIGTVGESGRGD